MPCGAPRAMKLKVNLAPYGQGTHESSVVYVQCGPGEQILRWLGFAACSRLAYMLGDVPSAFVPQSLLTTEGVILDVDTVINELYKDGDTVHVEYSAGPEAYVSRWEGRPVTPPFQWGEGGPVRPSESEWLEALDFHAHGVEKLVNEDLVAANAAALQQDLDATKEVLLKYGGLLQAVYKYYETVGEQDSRDLGKMSLAQFRTCMLDAKVTTEQFRSTQLDDCFRDANEDPAAGKGAKKASSDSSASLAVKKFMVALLHIANKKFAIGLESPGWGYSQLAIKLQHLVTDYIQPNLVPAIESKLQKLEEAFTPDTELLLKKGRRLTEQTLDSCQLRRVASEERQLDVNYLATHMEKWGVVGEDKPLNFHDLFTCLLLARQSTTTMTEFLVKRVPMTVTYDEFERLLAATAYHVYTQEGPEEQFVEFLGEWMNNVFKKSGILVEVRRDDV